MHKISGILAVPGFNVKARAARLCITMANKNVDIKTAVAKTLGWPVLVPFIYLGLVAGLLFHGASCFLGVPMDWVLVLTFSLITYGIYQINSYSDPGDAISHGNRFFFFKRHMVFKYLGILSLAGSAILLVISGRFTSVHAYLLSAGCMYSISLVPWYSPKRGWHFTTLKRIPLMKGLIIASAWGPGGIIVLLQHYQVQAVDRSSLWAVVAAGVVSNFINNTAADTHDLTADLHEGVKTLPVMLGVRYTYILLCILAVLFLAFLGLLSGLSFIEFQVFAYAAVLCLYALFIKIPCHRYMTKSNKSWLDLLADSYLLLQYAGLVILSLVAVPAI